MSISISESDQELIKAICICITNEVMKSEADDTATELALLTVLDKALSYVDMKYGKTSSSLATRADYLVDDLSTKAKMLEEAHEIAKLKDDSMDILLTTVSLCELHLEKSGNLEEGRKWLFVLKKALKDQSDDYYQERFSAWAKEYLA